MLECTKIVMRDGTIVLIDMEDLPLLNCGKCFRKSFYGAISLVTLDANKKTKLNYIHRIIMNAPENYHVDHINGNRLDNRKANLRLATHAQNQRNKSKRKDSKLSYKGICLGNGRPNSGYRGKIKFNTKVKLSKRFNSQALAAIWYDQQALMLHGNYANINFDFKCRHN